MPPVINIQAYVQQNIFQYIVLPRMVPGNKPGVSTAFLDAS
jgi:hypothetical protein